MQYLGAISKMTEWSLFVSKANPRHDWATELNWTEGKPFNITVIQVFTPTSNAEEAKVEQFYADLQDILELTPKKDVFFIIGMQK